MYLVINKWVIAVNVSTFSGQYLRNHWTLDIGVLGYIGIVWPKEHSPEVWSVPPVIPCIRAGEKEAHYIRAGEKEAHYIRAGQKEEHYIRAGEKEAHYIRAGEKEAHYIRAGEKEAHYIRAEEKEIHYIKAVELWFYQSNMFHVPCINTMYKIV